MKYVDDIIKYLSKEMSGEEESYFREQLNRNKEFNLEYEQINSVWIKLKEYLVLKEQNEDLSREEFIAELIAEQDILTYRRENESNQTKKFRRTLQKISNRNRRNIFRQRLYILSTSTAALIALLILVRAPWLDSQELLVKYYTPENESAIIDNIIKTRTDTSSAMDLFSEQSYKKAMYLFEIEHNNSPNNNLHTICYALSCYESGYFEKAVSLLEIRAKDRSSEYADLAAWYLSLIYAREEHLEKSKAWLIIVKERKCKYSRNAKTLLQKL